MRALIWEILVSDGGGGLQWNPLGWLSGNNGEEVTQVASAGDMGGLFGGDQSDGGDQRNTSGIPDNISSGTGGTKQRSAKATKLAGDLGRYMYKTLQPQTASNYGDFSYASEHPDFGGSFRRSYDSWHNYDRAIDIGAFWKDANTGNNDQKKVLSKVLEFNAKRGVKPVELLYGKPNTPLNSSHKDHVHVAYHKGGQVLGRGERMARLLGGEMVIDVDSAGPAKDLLLAINQASGREGVMKAIRDYAPYEAIQSRMIPVPVEKMVPVPVPMPSNSGGVVPIPMGGSAGGSTTEVLAAIG